MPAIIYRGRLLIKKDGNEGKAHWVTIRGRHLLILGPPNAKQRNKIDKKLKWVESKIRNKPVEHGVIIDKKGDTIWAEIGEEDYIDVTSAIEKGLLYENIFTHNHPQGTAFSKGDILMMLKYRVSEIRAVTEDYNHIMKVPPNLSYDPKFLHKIVRKIYVLENQVGKKAFEDEEARWLGANIPCEDANHIFSNRVAKEIGAKYERKNTNDY